ncbi:hypothetical protein M885DRAFT_590409 [Pelagophyceae sp. CCMP2097]|nr:hypothetical protein M885DRAFT_590409 [Pelagophyceae sp. CCMP2097]|mmetsp:Transcript_23570/g.80509  ORF Transcript_23570/g.80509 Transcript_23570/m.80509 type:complete len:226 (-) Transcript_23570:767-1444(-)
MGVQVSQLKLQYFNLVSPVILPVILALELGGVDYVATKVEFADWPTVKATTPTGALPVAQLSDGMIVVESGAISRGAAAASGMLGEGANYLKSEMLMGMSGDLNKKVLAVAPTVFNIAAWTPEQTEKAKTETLPDVLAHVALFVQFLLPAGDRFTESGQSLGEVDLFAKLFCLKAAFPQLVEADLKAFYDRVAALPAVVKFNAGETQWGSMPLFVCAFPEAPAAV